MRISHNIYLVIITAILPALQVNLTNTIEMVNLTQYNGIDFIIHVTIFVSLLQSTAGYRPIPNHAIYYTIHGKLWPTCTTLTRGLSTGV